MANSSEIEMELAIDVGMTERPVVEGAASGDIHVVKEYEAGVLMAVLDGSGHGALARDAAMTAARILEAYAGEPTATLTARCHEALKSTRGASMTLVWFRTQEDRIEWVGVGNVQGWLIRAGAAVRPRVETIVLQRGVLGYRLPLLRPASLAISPRDVVVLATDGIFADFAETLNVRHAPSRIAADIMGRRWKGNDDALVVVARYLGTEA